MYEYSRSQRVNFQRAERSAKKFNEKFMKNSEYQKSHHSTILFHSKYSMPYPSPFRKKIKQAKVCCCDPHFAISRPRMANFVICPFFCCARHSVVWVPGEVTYRELVSSFTTHWVSVHESVDR